MHEMTNIVWSYSSLKTFGQCAKKYYHLKVAKDVVDTGSEATSYGKDLHKAAELFIKEGTPLPGKFKFLQPTLDVLNGLPGDKYCELELGVRKTETGYEPCGFSDADAWWHGVGDLIIVNEEEAYSFDYKSSKNAKYADLTQLDIMAAAIFTRFPNVKTIKSGLIFVVSNELVRKVHHAHLRDSYFASFGPELDRLAAARKNNVWNTGTGPLCRFCPVVSCEHNRKS